MGFSPTNRFTLSISTLVRLDDDGAATANKKGNTCKGHVAFLLDSTGVLPPAIIHDAGAEHLGSVAGANVLSAPSGGESPANARAAFRKTSRDYGFATMTRTETDDDGVEKQVTETKSVTDWLTEARDVQDSYLAAVQSMHAGATNQHMTEDEANAAVLQAIPGLEAYIGKMMMEAAAEKAAAEAAKTEAASDTESNGKPARTSRRRAKAANAK